MKKKKNQHLILLKNIYFILFLLIYAILFTIQITIETSLIQLKIENCISFGLCVVESTLTGHYLSYFLS